MITAFAVTATAAYLIYFGLTVALHLRPSPYHPLSNTVSDYSRSMSGWMNRAAILINGVGTALLLAVLHHLAHGSTARPALVELGVVAATRIAMAFVLADEPGQRRTAWGTSHAAIAILSFLAAVSAVGGFTLFRLSSAAPMQHLLAALALPLLGVLTVCCPTGLHSTPFISTLDANPLGIPDNLRRTRARVPRNRGVPC